MNRWTIVASLGLALACGGCKDDPADPGNPPTPATISVVAGDLQTAAVGTVLPVDPVVRVADAQGAPIAGASVSFVVVGGDGSVSAATVATGADGNAATHWTLGTTPGAKVLRASVGPLAIDLSATAVAGPAAAVTRVQGDGQVAAPGTAVPVAPVVAVTDTYGNPVAGEPVQFAVTGGGGYVFSTAVETDAAGQASCAAWTLGDVRGANSMTATVAGVAPVAFAASVNAEVLLDLGHTSEITLLRFEGSRVLSQEASGRWVLRDFDTCAILASGRSLCETDESRCTDAVALAGPTVLIAVPAGLELRASSDGHLLATVPTYRTPSWIRLATDGSYVAAAFGSEHLMAWSSTGQLLFDHPANYFTARAFAAPGALRVARGPAGASVIETISVPGGTSSVSPAFSGQFHSWFTDGERFLTSVSTTVWTYSATGTREAMWSLPTVAGLTGQGTWVWTYYNYPDRLLSLYALDGGGAPAVTFTVDAQRAQASGTTISLYDPEVSVVDLSGAVPTKTDYAFPLSLPRSFAATGSTRFVMGDLAGVLVDGASLATTPRTCGWGAARSIAGSASRGALATMSGSLFQFDAATGAFGTTIPFLSSKLEMSSDGTLLGARLGGYEPLPPPSMIELFALPSGSEVASWPSWDFSLSGSGLDIGLVTLAGGGACDREVRPVAGGAATWSSTGSCDPILLSPNGRAVATSVGGRTTSAATWIYVDGVLQTTVPGLAVGWIDDSRLLVNTYENLSAYASCTIYDPTGSPVASPALPELSSLQTVSADAIYSPHRNSIFSLTTGEAIWTSAADHGDFVGAVAGARVVFSSGSRILSEPY